MITDKDCLMWLKKADEDFNKEYTAIKEKRDLKKRETLKAWAFSNARFSIGDIIELFDRLICIDKITGDTSGDRLFCVYWGPVLTRQLSPRKNGERTCFYDNGAGIKLIKKHKEDQK